MCFLCGGVAVIVSWAIAALSLSISVPLLKSPFVSLAVSMSLLVHAPQRNSCGTLFWIRNSLWVHDMHCISYMKRAKVPFWNVIHNETFNILLKDSTKDSYIISVMCIANFCLFATRQMFTILCTRKQDKCLKKMRRKNKQIRKWQRNQSHLSQNSSTIT